MNASELIGSKRTAFHQRAFFFCICLIAASLPFSQKLNSIFIVFLSVNWIFEGDFIKKIDRIKVNKLFFLFISLYLLIAISLIYSDNLKDGTFQLEKKLSLLILPLILASSNKLDKHKVKIVLKLFVLSTFGASIVCLAYAFHRNNYFEGLSSINWFYFSYYDLTEILGIQPNYLALFTGFSILVVIYFLWENWMSFGFYRKISMVFLSIFLSFFLLLLSARILIGATFFILFLGISLYFIRKQSVIKGLAIIIFCFGFLSLTIVQLPIVKERFFESLNFKQNPVWINQFGDGTGGKTSIRLEKWRSSWSVIAENWLIGVGIGDSQDSLQDQYLKTDFKIGLQERFNAHNQFLEVWIGIGLIGLICFLAYLGIPAYLAYMNNNIIHLMLILLFSLFCLTESVLERQWGVVFFTLFHSMFTFSDYKNESNRNRS